MADEEKDHQWNNRLPLPTWIPRKAANVSASAQLGSWRSDPVPAAPESGRLTPPPDAAFGSAMGATRYPEAIVVVRAAQCSRDAFAAAVQEAERNAAMEARQPAPTAPSRVFEVGAPRSIAQQGAKKGTSPLPEGGDPTLPNDSLGGTDGMGGGIPSLDLGQSKHQEILCTAPLFVAFLPTQAAGDHFRQLLTKAAPESVVDVARRPFPPTCTVVVKGMPLSIKHDRMWEELSQMPSGAPTYIRFHRNDRGLFKNVLYVRFPSRIKAEVGRMELERLSIGGRALKVEFKKARLAVATAEEAQRAEAARREDLKALVVGMLEEAVQDLLKNKPTPVGFEQNPSRSPHVGPANREWEGFSFAKSQLSSAEFRYLKGLCQAHQAELVFELTMTHCYVKRKLPEGRFSRVSPAMGPARTPPFGPLSTPSHHAIDLGETSGLQFRGIRHWKEQRDQQGLKGTLPITRPIEPGQAAPWGAGRGRPAAPLLLPPAAAAA